jgi:hypothetical protein
MNGWVEMGSQASLQNKQIKFFLIVWFSDPIDSLVRGRGTINGIISVGIIKGIFILSVRKRIKKYLLPTYAMH